MIYIKIYNSIIESAKRTSKTGYTEIHHIVPKCMGGTNEPENLVKLTAREHYLCHWLLAKHYNNKQLWAAFSMMIQSSTNHSRIISGRMFERAKIARSKSVTGKNNPMYGKPSACKSHSEETKEKIRQSKLGKKRTPFTRMSPTEETRLKMSQAKKGKPNTKLKGRVMEKYTCPHCNKVVGGVSNFRRYHGDNCKNAFPKKE